MTLGPSVYKVEPCKVELEFWEYSHWGNKISENKAFNIFIFTSFPFLFPSLSSIFPLSFLPSLPISVWPGASRLISLCDCVLLQKVRIIRSVWSASVLVRIKWNDACESHFQNYNVHPMYAHIYIYYYYISLWVKICSYNHNESLDHFTWKKYNLCLWIKVLVDYIYYLDIRIIFYICIVNLRFLYFLRTLPVSTHVGQLMISMPWIDQIWCAEQNQCLSKRKLS